MHFRKIILAFLLLGFWPAVSSDTESKQCDNDFTPVKKSHRLRYSLEKYVKNFSVKPDELMMNREFMSKFKFRSDFLRLSSLEFDVLAQLSDDDFLEFLKALEKIPIKVKWRDRKNFRRPYKSRSSDKDYKKMNACFALLVFAGLSKREDIVTRIIYLLPESVFKLLKHDFKALVSFDVAIDAIVSIIKQENDDISKIPIFVTMLIKIYIERFADENEKMLESIMNLFIDQLTEISEKEKFSLKQKGILLGAILSGSLLYAKSINDEDTKRILAVNAISNLIWAATGFLSIFPFSSTMLGILSGGISEAAVIWNIIDTECGTRNFESKIRQIEGYLEMMALNESEDKKNVFLDMISMLAYMKATIHLNGLGD